MKARFFVLQASAVALWGCNPAAVEEQEPSILSSVDYEIACKIIHDYVENISRDDFRETKLSQFSARPIVQAEAVMFRNPLQPLAKSHPDMQLTRALAQQSETFDLKLCKNFAIDLRIGSKQLELVDEHGAPSEQGLFFTENRVAVSVPEIMPDGNYAALEVSHACGPLCGSKRLVFMILGPEGRWVVSNEIVLAIS